MKLKLCNRNNSILPFQTYLEYSRRGARVLALAYKEFGILDAQAARDIKREDVERDLIFAGFLIISCPLKPDSKAAIKEIVKSSHKVVMITGDNPLTACHVAKELRFTRKPVLVLTPEPNTDDDPKPRYAWMSINEDHLEKIDIKNYKKLIKEFDLAITGDGLQYLNEYKHDYFLKVIPYIAVYARFAPKQKEFVITSLKSLGRALSLILPTTYYNPDQFFFICSSTGYFTLMCGDGTNDVGALKHADVGVSILSNASVTSKKPIESIPAPIVPPTNASNAVNNRIRGISERPLTARERAIAKHRDNSQVLLQKALKDMEESQVQIVKLGDASIAAPFTSKLSSITCGKLTAIHLASN